MFPKMIVFYRWCVFFCITSVIPCCSQHFEHFMCQVSFLTHAPESHRTTFFFSLLKKKRKKHEPQSWSNSLEKGTGNSSCLLSFLTSISFISWLLQISGICIINRRVYIYVWVSAAYTRYRGLWCDLNAISEKWSNVFLTLFMEQLGVN